MSARTDVVLVGGGHSHVQVLRRFGIERHSDIRLTVVLDTPVAVYSGMVPGFLAGQYRAEELEIDVVPLARRAGARVILSAAVSVDPRASRIELDGRPPIPYDYASLDVGSTVAGLDLPGVRQHALATRPIGRCVAQFEEILSRLGLEAGERPIRVVVVGGGVGGVEIAFTLQERLRREGFSRIETTLLHDGNRILPGSAESMVRRAERRAASRGIDCRCGVRVVSVQQDRVHLVDGGAFSYDLLAWVTGAVGTRVIRESDLPLEERGFVKTRATLQVEGVDNLFAVGDCATLAEFPATPKAGVYAVRQGPCLSDNLVAIAGGRPLRRYRPQSDFLALLNLGDGTAIGSKWGRSFEGAWVMRLKDYVDRRFVRRFQVLEPGGVPTSEFPRMDGDEMAMLCGGCAAKVGQAVLERALERIDRVALDRVALDRVAIGRGSINPDVVLGLAGADDAAAYRTPAGDLVTTSVDLFSAFTDDPYLVGRAAAVNALSDLLATGVEPSHALAIVAVPEEMESGEAEELLFQTLAGAGAALDEARVALLGGHTTTAAKLMVGFSVDGFAAGPASLLRIDALEPGLSLVLTKPLGTGVVFHADMQGLSRGPWLQAALASVLRSNASALHAARAAGARAMTDVTGFGLVGHLGEMLRASRVSAELDLASLPVLPGALELLERGLRSTFHAENEHARRGILIPGSEVSSPRTELLFDPQTSGGLLFAVDPSEVEGALADLLQGGDPAAAVIGRVLEPRADGVLLTVGS